MIKFFLNDLNFVLESNLISWLWRIWRENLKEDEVGCELKWDEKGMAYLWKKKAPMAHFL